MIVKEQSLRILNLSSSFALDSQKKRENYVNFSHAFQPVLKELALCIFLQTLIFISQICWQN